MISQLPRWVWAGAGGLAFLAGIVNAVGLLGFNHQAITHLTGTTSMLAAAAAAGDVRQFLHLAAIIAGFFAGGVVGTIAFHHLGCATLWTGRRHRPRLRRLPPIPSTRSPINLMKF